jgi:hypothetical protein
MRRPLYITELAAQPFPLGLIGHILQDHKAFLQTVCFQDNEMGDAANATESYRTKIVRPVNDLLKRNMKNLRLGSIEVDHGRHHTVTIRFSYKPKAAKLWVDDAVRLSLFLASKKSMAMERKAEEDGEEFTVVAPRRGVAPVKRAKNRKRQKARKAQ